MAGAPTGPPRRQTVGQRSGLLRNFRPPRTRPARDCWSSTNARAILNDILTIAGQDPMPNETVKAFLRAWVAGKRGNTGWLCSGTVDRFLEHVSDKKAVSLTSIAANLAFFLVGLAPAGGLCWNKV